MKAREAELFALYNQFLGLMVNEKAAKENYLKAVAGNLGKVDSMKAKLKKESTETNTSVLMIALLDTYSKVLNKLEENLKGEVAYMEEKFISQLATSLKKNKQIVQNLNTSIELMQGYSKQLTSISEYKKSMHTSYTAFEDTLVDETIAKVVNSYSDDHQKKPNDLIKQAYSTRLFEYSSAVSRFNEEAPSILKQNVSFVH